MEHGIRKFFLEREQAIDRGENSKNYTYVNIISKCLEAGAKKKACWKRPWEPLEAKRNVDSTILRVLIKYRRNIGTGGRRASRFVDFNLRKVVRRNW